MTRLIKSIFKEIEKLTLAGKDNSWPSSITDSTFFIYSDKHSQLLRLNYDDGIQIYDELLLV